MTTTTKRLHATLVALLVGACGPEVHEEPELPGVLEYEHPYLRLHRLDRRVDAIIVEGRVEREECGMLTDRAYQELEDTLAALDPQVDYGYDFMVDDCDSPPGAWVHVEGFDHSPFRCDFQCCRPGLARAAVVYFLVNNAFHGVVLEFDGVPYVVIEPDEPCS